MSRLVFALIVLAALVACGAQRDLCDAGERLAIYRADLRVALVAALTAANIPFEDRGDGAICYGSEDSEIVLQRLKELDLEQRPRNRVTIPAGVVSEMVLDRLNAAAIHFQVTSSDDELTLTFEDEETAATAFAIVGEVFSDFSRPHETE
jgi:hypothetical protein